MRLLLLLTIFSFNARANYYYELHYTEEQEPEKSRVQDKALTRTRTALMRFKQVRQRTKYFTRKLKNLTFGEYSDEVMYLAPFVSGEFQFSVSDIDFYYDRNSEKAGLRYKFNF